MLSSLALAQRQENKSSENRRLQSSFDARIHIRSQIYTCYYCSLILTWLSCWLEGPTTAQARAASWLECHPGNRKVSGSIPSHGTCLGCRFGPWLMCVWEATGQRFFPSRSPPISPGGGGKEEKKRNDCHMAGGSPSRSRQGHRQQQPDRIKWLHPTEQGQACLSNLVWVKV